MTHRADGISVIICAYTEERFDNLVIAIESVKQQTVPAREIIIVIDHNARLLMRIRIKVPDVVVVENSGDHGLAGARNTGLAVATGSLVAFLDDDAIATPSWLEQLCVGFADHRVIGTGGTLTPLWELKEPAWFPAEFHWVVGCSYLGMPQTVTSIRNPIGANMAFRRRIFDEIGGFQAGIGRVGSHPISGEETELCIRARQLLPGSMFLHQPQANVFHHVPVKRTTWDYFCLRCYSEGLSKAIVTQSTGTRDGLASERAYMFRTLPIGVLRGFSDGLFRLDFAGWARAGAIIAGLSITVWGYVIGKASIHVAIDHKKLVHKIIQEKQEKMLSGKY
ncbi:glycosyltransferase family 2 protein [Dictyobacter formicarum]|uniref:Glycosyltransferase 2-like domain-containing protein n=1 Tax=Dictyobacter formicarum TaxID=2778368 RepID=A0ABQ3VAK5_9CHLR|nr:glycosyltransferase family 2 protein [Dictyobacter formicarum]GHO83177.1 hypothetical protein KSZ_11830 [Dictyobacter formicarum]